MLHYIVYLLICHILLLYLDINECDENNGGCGDICINNEGSYECLCSGLIHNDICYAHHAYFRDVHLQDGLICRMIDTPDIYLPHISGEVCSVTNDGYPGVTCPESSTLGIASLTVDPELFTDNQTGYYFCCAPNTNCIHSHIATIYG